MKDGKFTAGDIYALLLKRHSDASQWLCAGEVGNSTGGGRRRLDFVAANCYSSECFAIHAFEIKISKSDLRRELTDPTKHNIFFDDIDTYSIVAPDYVLDAEYIALIPKKWGIYQAKAANPLGGENTLRVVRKPLALHDERHRTIDRAFAFEMMRSMRGGMAERNALLTANYEEYKRGYLEGERYTKRELERANGRIATLCKEQTLLRNFASKVGVWRIDEENIKKTIAKIDVALAMSDALDKYKWDFDSLRRKIDDCEEWFRAVKAAAGDSASSSPQAPSAPSAPTGTLPPSVLSFEP